MDEELKLRELHVTQRNAIENTCELLLNYYIWNLLNSRIVVNGFSTGMSTVRNLKNLQA